MTFFLETFRLGLTNLRLHLLRSVLTALGIILGVASVIVMSSLGEGAKRAAMDQIEQLGARNIIVRSQKPPETQTAQQGQRSGWVSRFGLTRQEFEVISFNFPNVERIVPLKSVGGQVLRNERRMVSQAFGTTPELLSAINLRVERGRYLTEQDMQGEELVAIIGSKVAENMFPLEDPLGQTFRIDSRVFTVVGVLRTVGLAGGTGAALVGRDLNLDVHIPLTTARAVFGDATFRGTGGNRQNEEVQVSEVIVTSLSRDTVLVDAERMKRILEVRRTGMTDVSLHVPYELLESARKQAITYQMVFGSIAGIALLVGGIGIMNIMLASVTERTKEIGIRRAMGATKRNILLQFLVETGVLSTLGGVLGVGLGVGLSVLVGQLVKLGNLQIFSGLTKGATDLPPTQVTLWSILLSFTVAVLTGLVFGIYPARRAAAQDPIVALRH
jgi:putative ABC transport system permease protein